MTICAAAECSARHTGGVVPVGYACFNIRTYTHTHTHMCIYVIAIVSAPHLYIIIIINYPVGSVKRYDKYQRSCFVGTYLPYHNNNNNIAIDRIYVFLYDTRERRRLCVHQIIHHRAIAYNLNTFIL